MTTNTESTQPVRSGTSKVVDTGNYYKNQTIARRKAEAIRDEMKLNKEYDYER